MLQRAASNANSLWWASNIRTKQLKWLDTDLQEMEERVKSMLNVVEGDGDYSFAKKAEIYFKKRPELVHSIEETYKAYRALADKFDHVSSELHKANHTIATACPDQIPFGIQDYEDCNSPKAIVSIDSPKVCKADIPQNNLKKSRPTKPVSQNNTGKSQEEIDKLQKAILVLETEKEFIKSLYESGISRYLDIEKQITEIQEEVFSTQDEFNAIVTIDDDEARTLMAATAIKSCEDSVAKLQEQQKQSMEEARIEFERIKIAKVKIKSESSQFEENSNIPIAKVSLDAESLCERIEIPSHTSMVELTEKINELVSKVIDLEMTASSQTAQIKSMRSEADIIQMRLQSFEEEKKSCIDNSNKLLDKAMVGESSTVAHHSIDDVSAISEVVTSLHNTEAPRICEEVKEVKETVTTENNIVEEYQGVKEVGLVLKDQKDFAHSMARFEISSCDSNSLLDDKEISLNRLQSLANGFEGKERIILTECTSILQDYTDTKKRLSEIEKKNQEHFLEMEAQISELKNANAMKDEEINSLQQNLRSLPPNSNDHSEIQLAEPEMSENSSLEELFEVRDNDIKLPATEIEEKFRRDIDKVLEKNLEFWLRFSASFHNIQKFETTVQELQLEIKKLGYRNSLPIGKKLIELKTAIRVYLEENMLLQREMETKISSINSIQDEISETLQASLEADVVKFAHQATKFQGELRNMQLENNNASKELKARMTHINDLKYEVEKTLLNLKEKFEVEEFVSKNQEHSSNCSPKRQIPLRVFLADAKNKKKQSIFACAGNLHHL